METKPSDSAHGGANSENIRQHHRPYWKRAHLDWRCWVAVVFIFTAMVIYVLTINLEIRPRNQLPPPIPDSSGK